MRDEKIKFTGGDHLTGVESKYHQVMMKNELINGYDAYQLSYAGGESKIIRTLKI